MKDELSFIKFILGHNPGGLSENVCQKFVFFRRALFPVSICLSGLGVRPVNPFAASNAVKMAADSEQVLLGNRKEQKVHSASFSHSCTLDVFFLLPSHPS